MEVEYRTIRATGEEESRFYDMTEVHDLRRLLDTRAPPDLIGKSSTPGLSPHPCGGAGTTVLIEEMGTGKELRGLSTLPVTARGHSWR
jgi:hypothetical protein